MQFVVDLGNFFVENNISYYSSGKFLCDSRRR
jgi:hypothetical protein